MTAIEKVNTLRDEIGRALREQVIPFWLERAVDRGHGGYLTCFDERGRPSGDTGKYIVTQTRMLWGFMYLSDFGNEKDKAALAGAARQGMDFFADRFWDSEHGGFVWKTDRAGHVIDGGKLLYGQSFALYALAEYHRKTGDGRALSLARETLSLMLRHAADTCHGGFYENLEPDWSLSPGGKYAGDRKSLDIHMHIMEALTTLYAADPSPFNARKLREIADLIVNRMINRERGYGYNQFTADFTRVPAINIHRTWNAERETGEVVEAPTDTTSYGHNVELSWLLDLALTTLGADKTPYLGVIRKLLDHSLAHGFDYEYGGLYRDGVADGEALVRDKEWWQNFEALVGYANGYLLFHDERYLDALRSTWAFDRDHFMNSEVGESRQLLDRAGRPLIADLGNPWKGIYHTGRSHAECAAMLPQIKER